MSLVLDTHAVVWYALDSDRLSPTARARLDEAVASGYVYVSAITVVEVIYLVEKDRLPDEALSRLLALLRDPSSRFEMAPLDIGVAAALRDVPRDAIPDMPDRIIAATARHLGFPLLTRDRAIQSSSIDTIW